MTFAVDPGGIRSMHQLGGGLLVVGLVAAVGGALTGGTVVAGVFVPGPVGVVAGTLTSAIGGLLMRWTSGRRKQPAIDVDDGVLRLHCHAGPPLQVPLHDLNSIGRVRTTQGPVERIAFGQRLFTVTAARDVSPGLNQIPVGEKYLVDDIESVRDALAGLLTDHDQRT